MAKRTIYLARITRTELQKQWNEPVFVTWDYNLLIRCTKEGKVNWEKNQVYTFSEIYGKDEFKIVEGNWTTN